MSGYPLPIAGNWPGWPSGWQPRTAVKWDSNTVYIFGNTTYLRYDIANDRVLSGYPNPIGGNWAGWPKSP